MNIKLLEVFSVSSAIFTTFLTIRQKVIRWPVDIFLLLVNLYIHHSFELYDRWILTIINLGLDLYGWNKWKFGGKNKSELSVSRPSTTGIPLIAILGLIGTGLIYLLLTILNSNMPLLGAFRTSFAFCGIWLASNKRQEHWFLWIFLNTISIYIYLNVGLYFFALKYCWYIAFNIIGYYQWNKDISRS